jgi:uncharacterized cupredoxin-like copper-binding protein
MRVRYKMLVALVAGAMAFATIVPAGASAPKLKVRLIEFKIQPARDFLAAGKTNFVAKNAGGDEHEVVVVRGDDPGALPTKANGAVDEKKIPKADKFGEIEEFKPGKTESKVFKLSPGSYVLFCNVVEEEADGTVESHFEEGMYTTIEVS